MKVLHVSTAATWRGGEQQLLYLVQGLADTDVQQSVVTPAGSRLGERLAGMSIPVVHYKSRFTLPVLLSRIVRKEKFDIVHVHDAHAHTSAVIAASMFGMPSAIVLSRRVDFPVSPTVLSRWKYNHPSIKKIICVSDAVCAVLRPDIKDPRKLCVVHDGVSLHIDGMQSGNAIRAELNLEAATKLVGNVSALADHKDHPTFLRTAASVLAKHPEVHFILAGAGPEETRIRELVNTLGLQEKVHLLGFRSDPARIIASLDVFLMTSKTEGLGSVVMDAFSLGIPVVATAAGGLPELVENRKTGLLAPVGDDRALAAAVISVLYDESLGKSLAEKAREKVAQMSYLQMAQKTLSVYRQL